MKRIYIALLALFVSNLCLAQVASRPADQWIPRLEAPDRVENLRIPRVIAALHLRQGDVVADIGAGSGVFSRPLAKQIAPGILYAVDIDPELLKHIDATCRSEKIDNVKTVLGATDDPKLPENVALIFLCDTVHHIANPDKYVKKLPAYLKPGGRIAVIDFRDPWPGGHESLRFTPEQLESWMKAAGMKKVEDLNIPKDAFFHIYARE
ncbi:MAG TPA: methyltransferase domain-containing protein [Acidobacteriota bacterium]|nr:methyltransferase domain-containing protein [Acidobacteriota bacterium]